MAAADRRRLAISGVHAYASGYPLTVLPGYGLPLNAGDNRITVLDYHDWRAATQGDNFDPLVDLWWDPAKFLRTGPVDSIDQLQGYKGGVLRADFGNATVRNPYERGPWYMNENISLARTFGIAKTLWSSAWKCSICSTRSSGAPESTITNPNFGRVTQQANPPRQMQLGLRFEF